MIEGLISLGSNVGERSSRLADAMTALQRTPGVRVEAASRRFETAPIGGPSGQEPFLNAAVRIRTLLPPPDLLARLLAIETDLGRVRHARWGPRTIDLDLLLWGDATLDTPALTLPHPRLAWRRFVLDAAVEVGGLLRHPRLGLTIAELWRRLSTTPPLAWIDADAATLPPRQRRLAADAAEQAGAALYVQPADLERAVRWAPPGAVACGLAIVPRGVLQGDRRQLWPPRLQVAWADPPGESAAAAHGPPGIPRCWLPIDDDAAARDELTAALQAMR